ncbi:MAG: hypothetical protein ACOCYC_03505 [bacterium]
MSSTHEIQIEEKLIPALKKRRGIATVGDMVADTGLPADDVEAGLRRLLGIYRSHLDVDDAGNIRYRFDPRFTPYGEEPRRVWYKIRRALKQAAAVAFKVWIVLMIVGYTAAFVLLLLAAGLGMIGLTMASGDDGGGEGLGELGILPLYFMMRVLEFMFWVSLFDNSGNGMFGRRIRKRRSRKPDKPFYQKVFDYVFGPAEARPDPLEAQQFFARLVREHDGILTSADWARYTGHSLSQARDLLTACALRFRGHVDMTEEGNLLFRFDELAVSAADRSAASSSRLPPLQPIWEREYRLPPVTGNKRSTNVWISILNGFNMTMGAVVLVGVPATTAATLAALGWIPLTFSALLFSVPLVRRIRHGRKRKRAKMEMEWRELLARVYDAAEHGAALAVTEVPSELQGRLMTELSAESRTDEEGRVSFRFPELEAELALSRSRRAVGEAEASRFGRSIFSTDDDTAAMNEKDAADFDARLQRELAAQT